MMTEEDKKMLKLLEGIDKNVTEIIDLVHDVKLWRKMIVWAFGAVTFLITVYEFCKDFFSWKTK